MSNTIFEGIEVKSLTLNHSYTTPESAGSWLGRLMPTATFYSRIFWIVYKASHQAKRGKYRCEQWISSSLNCIRALEAVGGKFSIENADFYKRLDSPCVFISNHMSILETFVLPCIIQPFKPVTFVVKESLIEYPFFKHVMRSRKPVVVGRTNPREDLKTVMLEGQQRLESGVSIVIFPQTTRDVVFDPKKFNSLGVKLAKRCGVPVVPIALKTNAWGLGKKIKDFGKIQPSQTVHICFGEPMQIHGSGKEEHQKVVEFITGNLADWQSNKETIPAPRP
jgi:1-acyl-sn-glycerol-3-phosphate acyltransferase